MAMPTPSPGFPDAQPGPIPTAPAMPSSPVCAACGDTVVVNWRRRLTDDELAEHIALEEQRRERVRLLADPQLPAPAFRPLPDGTDDTRLVLACAEHAIDKELASRIHQKTCTAPNENGQWGCDCTPEPHPEPPAEEPSRLPAHWQTGGD